MRRFVSVGLALALLLLSGCFGKGTAQPDTTAEPTELPYVEPSEASTQPTEPSEASTRPTEPEETLVADDRLKVVEIGRYSGKNPEGGSDEDVENVVALRVENVSNQVCQFCTIEYEIGGQHAVFQLSELPVGKSAWVLESTGMTAEVDADCTYQTCAAAFRDEGAPWLTNIEATGGGGELTVTNTGETDQPLVTVYYKLTYGDDLYLGGIAYRVTVSDLKAGESQTLPAGHFYEGACEIVGIYADGASQ